MLWITSLLLLLSLQTISGVLVEELGDVRRSSLASPPEQCGPDCPAGDNVKVENPKNCHQFYICVGDDIIGPLDCPDGQYFDSNTSDCVPDGPEECTPTCGGGGGGGGNNCTYKCGGDTAYVADRYDCSTYYTCSNGLVMNCGQETPYFDGETCQTEEKYCCHCNPYCYTGDRGQESARPHGLY
ncbi:uncharacterized protein LOC135096084 [Scylla paramamosain]|uniref:uncharacterized protein LOC135096084 n=1 Tax=Scylla paramamosain TaxID=85552 RepID=UPI003083AE1A